MNVNHDRDSEFESWLGQLPGDDSARPEHQTALRERVLAAFERALDSHDYPNTWKRVLHFGRNIMKRPAFRYLAAASVLAALVWIFWPGSNNAAAALDKMIDAVVSARSARFHAEINVEGQSKQTAQMEFLAPAKYRMVTDKFVSISDFEGAKMLTLMPDQKKAVVFNLKNVPKDGKKTDVMSHFETVRQLLRAQRGQMPTYERLGEKMIDGRKAQGFRLESGGGTLTLWGDPKTGHPIRIENIYSGLPRNEVVMTKFEINVDVKAERFAQDVPQGYQVQSFDLDASRAQERDFVESLRLCAEMSGGSFPDALDTQSVMKLMISKILDEKKEAKAKELDGKQLMEQSLKIGRGFQWALSLPASTKAHYAGKGVKKGTKDRAIFWYLPEGANRFRVIDATLTAYDADEAPRVEGAIPLGKKIAGTESK
jgi:outer membrane lipoprotein-sorting protein